MSEAKFGAFILIAGYNLVVNHSERADDTSNLSESFTYDPLNRLLSATVSTNVAPVKTLQLR